MKGIWRGALSAATLACLLASCGESALMQCQNSDSCIADGEQGTCEATGFCSFPDAACPSGRRYGEFAGTLSGACVDDDDGGSTAAMQTSSTTAEMGTSSGSSSTEGSTTSSMGASSSSSGGNDSSTGGIPTVPQEGLLAHYPISEGRSRVLNDVSGNALHGQISEVEPSFDKGQRGWVLGFDGNVARNVLLPLDARLETLQETSFSLVADVSYQPVFDPNLQPSMVVGRAGNNTGLTVSVDRGELNACICTWDVSDTIGCACAPIELTTWHRVVAVVDREGGEMRVYVDGFLGAAEPLSKLETLVLDSRWYIGVADVAEDTEFNDPMLGSIDNVLIYERALSGDEAFELSMN